MYLVTGGTGFLGSHLLNSLVNSGNTIKAIYRKMPTASKHPVLTQSTIEKVEWLQADLLDYDAMQQAIIGVTRIYHCAAKVSFNKSEQQKMDAINVDGTAQLVDLALAEGVKEFVHVSSVAAIGKGAEGAINEETPWKNSATNSWYGISKFRAELQVWRAKEEGLKVLIINPSIILGIGNWNEGSCRLFKTVFEGLKFYPPGTSGFVDVEDVVNAILKLTQQEIWGERFILSAHNLTYKELFFTMATGLKVTPPKYCPPRWLSELGWRAFAFIAFFTKSKPLVTKETTQSAYGRVLYDNSKLLNKIEFKYKTFSDSISEICTAYLNSHQKNQK